MVFYGDMHTIESHSKYELFAAIVVNLIATILKLGDKTQVGSVLLATSLVADIQLIAAAIVWTIAVYGSGMNSEIMAVIVSLSGGALLCKFNFCYIVCWWYIKIKKIE